MLMTKTGAPQKNRNAMRHGLRAGQLPKGASYIKRDCDALRRVIEDVLLAKHGEIDIYKSALIQTAIRWERHAMLVQRWLRKEVDDMNAMERIAYSKDIANASTNRDKCLKELGLHMDRNNVFDALYADEPDDPLEPEDIKKDDREGVVSGPKKEKG